jgi:hypothetical protein
VPKADERSAPERRQKEHAGVREHQAKSTSSASSKSPGLKRSTPMFSIPSPATGDALDDDVVGCERGPLVAHVYQPANAEDPASAERPSMPESGPARPAGARIAPRTMDNGGEPWIEKNETDDERPAPGKARAWRI